MIKSLIAATTLSLLSAVGAQAQYILPQGAYQRPAYQGQAQHWAPNYQQQRQQQQQWRMQQQIQRNTNQINRGR